MASMAQPIALRGGSPTAGLQTEFAFTLPRGYVDRRGRAHREGAMRLATARDEIAPQADPRVRTNPAFLTVLLLARTITRIDGVDEVDTEVVEQLFATDLAFLQDLYRRINQRGTTLEEAMCPHCGREFELDVAGVAVGE
jgi:hypothetical protein